MKLKDIFVPFSLALFLLLLSGCGPDIVEPGLPDRELYVPPPAPIGGTYDDPSLSIAASCSRFGRFVFDIRYSPADLYITSYEFPSSTHYFGGDIPWEPGWIHQVAYELDPFVTPVDFMLCYGAPDALEHPCMNTLVDLPACPPFVPDIQLYTIDCSSVDTIAVSVDFGTGLALSASACQSAGDCSDPSAIQYHTERVRYTYGGQGLFIGPRPQTDAPLHVCLRVPGQAAGTPDYCGTLNNFYSSYLTACLQPTESTGPTWTPHPFLPTSTSTVPPPPPACSEYNNGLDCGNAGCYWWVPNMTCHPDPDPCNAYNGTDEATCKNYSCIWDNKDSSCNTP